MKSKLAYKKLKFVEIIVATARLLDAKLITKDAEITISKEVDVVW